MKKLLLLFMLVITVVSCEQGIEGPPGKDGKDTNWFIQTYTVHEKDWILVGTPGSPNSYYWFEFKEDALSDFIYTDGNVFGYLIQNPGTKDEVQTPLAYNVPVVDGTGGWTEFYSFDFMPGSIAFYAKFSDFNTYEHPLDKKFRIVMNW